MGWEKALVTCRTIPGGLTKVFPAKDLRFRVATYGVALKDDRVLLGHSAIARWWELPGGGVEAGETLPEGLIREFEEETSVVPSVQEPVGFDEDFIAFWGHPFHGLRFFFRVDVPKEAVLVPQPGELLELAWRPIDELNEAELAPGHYGFILRAARGG